MFDLNMFMYWFCVVCGVGFLFSCVLWLSGYLCKLFAELKSDVNTQTYNPFLEWQIMGELDKTATVAKFSDQNE